MRVFSWFWNDFLGRFWIGVLACFFYTGMWVQNTAGLAVVWWLALIMQVWLTFGKDDFLVKVAFTEARPTHDDL